MVFAAGLGSLTAGLVAKVVAANDTFKWLSSLSPFALTLAAVFLPTAIGASLVMPPRTGLVRSVRGESEPALGASLMLLLVALCGAAMLQVPSLFAWWHEEAGILGAMLGDGSDPLGLNAIPATIVFSLPAVATLTLLLFMLTSFLALVAPSRLA